MKQFIFLSIFLLFCKCIHSQDAHFSQYNSSRLTTNPAFTGTDTTINISTGGRLQWYNINGGYKSFYFSADNYVRFLRGGIGLQYLNENEMDGAFVKTRMEFNYAPHFELFHHKLVIQPAFQIAYIRYTIDWSKLVWRDQIDERMGIVYHDNERLPSTLSKSNIDFSTGLLIYSTHFYGGIAVHHFTQPDAGFISSSKLPVKITIHSGAVLGLKTKHFTLSPNILYMHQRDEDMILPGISAKYKIWEAGISYRNDDAYIFTTGIQFYFLKLSYSYDYTAFNITNKDTGGTHEAHITWFLNYRKTLSTIKTLRLI